MALIEIFSQGVTVLPLLVRPCGKWRNGTTPITWFDKFATRRNKLRSKGISGC